MTPGGVTNISTRYRIQLTARDVEFSCEEGQTVLEAGLRQGVMLRHGCGHGECGSCKARIVAGEYELLDTVSPYAILPHELDEGWTLLCSTLALSDLMVEAEVEEIGDLALPPVRDVQAEVVALQWLAEDMLWVQCRSLQGPVRYLAGQYAEVVVAGEPQVRRAYSFASAPRPTSDLVDFLIRLVPSGVGSRYMANLRLGDRVAFSAPYGTTVIRPGTTPCLIVAGGSGIGPGRALLQVLADEQPERPVWLFQGARSQRQLIWHQEFSQWQDRQPKTRRYVAALSDEPAASSWQGFRLPIADAVAQSLSGVEVSDMQGYIFGPLPMVRAVRTVLEGLGMRPGHIYADEF
jgi:NAD(P)H-flavin reductase/ferredoxin